MLWDLGSVGWTIANGRVEPPAAAELIVPDLATIRVNCEDSSLRALLRQ